MYYQQKNFQNNQNPQSQNQNNTINNPQSSTVPEVKNQNMNDRDWANDILATEKYLTDSFNVFAREASHVNLHNDIRKVLNETHNCAREIFNVMFQEGFYQLEAAPKQKIDQARQKFVNYLNTQSPY
ncbi:MAG: spore coat protein [Halanaerobiales bacterium]